MRIFPVGPAECDKIPSVKLSSQPPAISAPKMPLAFRTRRQFHDTPGDIIFRAALSALAPFALAAALLAIPADEARAHYSNTAPYHDGYYIRSNSLHSAAFAGDLDSVRHMLNFHHSANSARVAMNMKNSEGFTPLLRATRGAYYNRYSVSADRYAAVVSVLIGAGAKVNAKNDDGETPLYFSARYGPVSVVSALIAAGAKVNAKNDDGETPLHRAAHYGPVSVVSALIAAGADLEAKTSTVYSRTSRSNNAGYTPLHFAAHYGAVSVVSALIAAGADLEAKARYGETPLHFAARYGAVPVVSALIAAGANLEAKALGYTPLHRAAAYNVSVVSALIAAGANVNAKGNGGYTPLHYSVRGPVSVVSALIAAGADVNATISSSETPLHRAVYNVSVVSALIAAGADVNAKTRGGWTPLHQAVIANVSVVSALIAAGANVNAKSNSGRTPLRATWNTSFYAPRGFHAVGAVAAPVLIAAGGHWGEACAKPAAVNPAGDSPPCLCESPNLGTPAECVAPGVESCGELTPPAFYDSAAGECGDPLYPCHDSAIRKADNSGCECPAGTFAHGDPSGGYRRTSKYGARHKNGRYEYIPNTAECHANHAPIMHDLNGWWDSVRTNNPTLVAHFIFGHGRDPDGGNFELHSAARNGYYSVAKTLIEGGADIERKRSRNTPLHEAVKNGRGPLITLLLQRGADADAAGGGGYTPLHSAARRTDTAENVALILFLLDKGATPNPRNDSGWRPLDLAYHGGNAATWQARRGIMAALINGGATWSDECTGGTIPNPNYRPSSGVADCVCPLHLSERDSRGACECPAHSHSQVNGRCLPKDSAQVEAEIAKMEAELLRLRAALVSLNAKLTAAAEMPREMVEEIAEQAGDTAQEIKRRRDNFLALARADLAGAPPPPVAMSDTAAECRMLGGKVQIHSATGIRVCSGIDANDTFCLVDSGDAYPCRGGRDCFPPPLAGAFGGFAPRAESGLRGAGRADADGGEPAPRELGAE